ncbi:hypothetical protein D515_00576 [Grimontia indica]|uniref:Uncharacterized protein n=1 Tax=Grimontia indica TaxID=1056512 RepID=R1GVU4_9GAMM|nr:hypothetical protein D515_00576 [Grimontia indica]
MMAIFQLRPAFTDGFEGVDGPSMILILKSLIVHLQLVEWMPE